VLYLDEPTTGLDPNSRTDVWQMVRRMVADGVTVLLTTQYLDEADQLAHDIVVIDHGKVIATGTPDELKAKTGGRVLEVTPLDVVRTEDVRTLLTGLVHAEAAITPGGEMVTVPVTDAAVLPRIVRELEDRGIELAEFSLRKASLDEVFFSLTGRHTEDQAVSDVIGSSS
jgi:oleandomycin transport system ATP-binding protein